LEWHHIIEKGFSIITPFKLESFNRNNNNPYGVVSMPLSINKALIKIKKIKKRSSKIKYEFFFILNRIIERRSEKKITKRVSYFLGVSIVLCLVFGSLKLAFNSLNTSDTQQAEMKFNKNNFKERPKMSVIHVPIIINGNGDFHTQALNEGWFGDGTEGNPYVIEDYIINISYPNYHSNGIDIQNTNVYFIIQKVTIHNEHGYDNSGFSLFNVKNGELRDNTAINNNYGFFLQYATNITLIGNTAYNDFTASYGTGFYLQNSTNNILMGNTVDSDNEYGFYLQSSANNTLTGNIASKNYNHGFKLNESSNNSFIDNIANDNLFGFYLQNSTNNNLIGNTANNNYRDGILLHSSANNVLTNNIFNNNGIRILSDTLEESIQTLVENNTVNGKDLLYFQNKVKTVISSEVGQIILVNCSSIQIEDIIIEMKASVGFLLMFSKNISMINNTAINNYYGFYFQYSTNSTLKGNTAINNHIGFHLQYSTNNTLTKNTANNNFIGFHLQYSINNTLTGNYPNDNDHGFYLYTSPNNILTDNVLINNGFGMHSYTVEDSIQSLVKNNTINGKDLIFLQNEINTIISSEAGQFILVNCSSMRIENLIIDMKVLTAFALHFSTNILIINNTFNNVFIGFHLWFSTNNTLIGNTANNNYNGFVLYASVNNTLIGNTANNNHNGFYLYGSSNNTLMGNIANYNDENGIYLGSSNYNIIRGNILLHNGRDCIVQHDCLGNVIFDNICEVDETKTIISSYNVVFLIGIITLVSLIYIKKRYINYK